MVTSWALLVLVLILIAITLNNSASLEVVGWDTQALIDEEKVHSVTWNHCPGGTGPPEVHTVSDSDYQQFKLRRAAQMADFPNNCP